jgi:hypothetical protein
MSVLGLTSQGSANNLIPTLRTLGIIDSNNSTTPRAHDWRDDDTYAKACADMVAEIYPEALTNAFPAPDPEADGVKKWFMRNAAIGDAAASQMTALYRLLCEADPKASEKSGERRKAPASAKAVARPATSASRPSPATKKPPAAAIAAPEPTPTVTNPRNPLSAVGGITINVELQLPPTADAKFFDQFFASMRKHLVDEE